MNLHSALFVVPYTQGAQAWLTEFYLQSPVGNACLYLVSVQQMTPPQTEVADIQFAAYHSYLPRKDERLSRPVWLTYSGRFTYMVSRQLQVERRTGESSPVKDQRSTTAPRNQH